MERHNATALARDKQYCGSGDFFELLVMNREMVKTGFIIIETSVVVFHIKNKQSCTSKDFLKYLIKGHQ